MRLLRVIRGDSMIYLTHHDVDAADDGGDIGDEAATADFVRDAEVTEATGTGADSQRDVFFVGATDDMEAHLPAWAFGFGGAFAEGQGAVRFTVAAHSVSL